MPGGRGLATSLLAVTSLLVWQSSYPYCLLQGILVTLAIGLHNIPEGLAVATVLVSRGVAAKRAAWWALATALPQPLLAVPSFMFVDTFTSLLPLALGFAAGCMTWMVFAELIPDALADAPHGKVGCCSSAPCPHCCL